ncbi:MAG: hypothetical protein KDD42_07240, partial [Bdellovibrionales bacterium]|nr:hypothetical protein [Bdellovibrionales bacterium]
LIIAARLSGIEIVLLREQDALGGDFNYSDTGLSYATEKVVKLPVTAKLLIITDNIDCAALSLDLPHDRQYNTLTQRLKSNFPEEISSIRFLDPSDPSERVALALLSQNFNEGAVPAVVRVASNEYPISASLSGDLPSMAADGVAYVTFAR